MPFRDVLTTQLPPLLCSFFLTLSIFVSPQTFAQNTELLTEKTEVFVQADSQAPQNKATQTHGDQESSLEPEDLQPSDLKETTLKNDSLKQTNTTENHSIDDSDISSEHQQASLNPNENNKIQAKLRQNPWIFLHPYIAEYGVHSEGDKLGSATRRMWISDGKWRLEITSKLKKWLLSLKSHEFSVFKIFDKQLLTEEFYTSTKISFKDERVIEQKFDWDKKIETGSKDEEKWTLPINTILYDRMSHVIQLRADVLANKTSFSYKISYKGKRKNYRYAKSGTQKLNTPFGEQETIRFNRISGDDGRFSVWLAPALNYFPVQIAQFEQDKPDVILRLESLEFSKEESSSPKMGHAK